MNPFRAVRFLLGLLFGLLLLAPFARSAADSWIFVDERGFIRAGDDAVSLLLNGNLSGQAWRSNKWGDYGWMNPQLAKVVMGLAVRVGATRQFDDPPQQRGLVITLQVLRAARAPAVLFAAGSCLLMFVIGTRFSVAGGVLAALLAAYNPFYNYATSLAILEAPAAFFSLLSIWLLLRLHDALEDESLTRFVPRRAAELGIALGLALASKYLCGILLIFAGLYFAATALQRVTGRRLTAHRSRCLLKAALLVVTIAPATFLALSPQFYDQPIATYRQTMAGWSKVYEEQGRSVPHYRVDDRTESAEVTLNALFLKTATQRWVDAGSARISRSGLRAIARSYTTSAFNVESLCLLVGAAVIVVGRWRAGWTSRWTDPEVILSWFVLTLTLFVMWLPLSYERYFMYPFLPTPILIAFGAVELFRSLRHVAAPA